MKRFHKLLYLEVPPFVKGVDAPKARLGVFLRKFFLYSAVFFLAFAVAAGGTLAIIYNSQKLDAAKLTAQTNSVDVFDGSGAPMPGTGDSKGVSLATLPDHVKWAFICVEDKDFYKHKGLSYNRIAKATYKNASEKRNKEGASTISQQLIKNTHLTHEKTLKRKIREAALAKKLEKKYDKDRILEMYLDAVYFGNGVYGLDSASRFYYDKKASELTVREAAGLAGMLKSPGRFDPVSNAKNFFDRTDYVIGMMHTQGKITVDQFQEARAETLSLAAKRKIRETGAYRAAAITQAATLVNRSVQELAAEGYKVFTFYDAAVQKVVDDTASNPDYQIKTVSDKPADTCIIAATPAGHITALHTQNSTLPTARRSFASALKPLVVFAPAIELGVVTPATIIKDEPYAAGDFHPKNFDGKFRGDVTVRESLAQSHNVPAVKILEYTRLPRAIDVAQGLGLPLGDENMSLALGNAAGGISFTELVGGYCALANGGLKTSPSFIRQIENRDGKVIWKYTEPYLRALSEDTCITMTDMLCSTVKTGTAKKLNSLKFDIAAKTGTAERPGSGENTDAVNVCYTPSNVLLVWHGNVDMKPENDMPRGTTGGGVPSFIARGIMQGITTKPASFKKPASKSINAPAETKPAKPAVTLRLDAKVGDTGAPEVRFNAAKSHKYDVYKKVGETTSLLVVVKNHDGEYIFTDRNATLGKMIEYWATVKIDGQDVKSNVVKIFTEEPINKNSTQVIKRSGGKHWFF